MTTEEQIAKLAEAVRLIAENVRTNVWLDSDKCSQVRAMAVTVIASAAPEAPAHVYTKPTRDELLSAYHDGKWRSEPDRFTDYAHVGGLRAVYRAGRASAPSPPPTGHAVAEAPAPGDLVSRKEVLRAVLDLHQVVIASGGMYYGADSVERAIRAIASVAGGGDGNEQARIVAERDRDYWKNSAMRAEERCDSANRRAEATGAERDAAVAKLSDVAHAVATADAETATEELAKIEAERDAAVDSVARLMAEHNANGKGATISDWPTVREAEPRWTKEAELWLKRCAESAAKKAAPDGGKEG